MNRHIPTTDSRERPSDESAYSALQNTRVHNWERIIIGTLNINKRILLGTLNINSIRKKFNLMADLVGRRHFTSM